MSTIAEKIASGDRQPTAAVKEAMEDVARVAKHVAAGLDDSLELGEIRDSVHLDAVEKKALAGDKAAQRALEAYRVDGAGVATLREHSGLSADEAKERAAEVHEDWAEGSTYAYRFEYMDDGSVLAVYVERAGQKPKFAAFADAAGTRTWHPTRTVADE